MLLWQSVCLWSKFEHNCISGVMVSMLTSSAVDCGFDPGSGQTKDNEIGIYCFFAEHTALRSESKDCGNLINVFAWSDMSTCRL